MYILGVLYAAFIAYLAFVTIYKARRLGRLATLAWPVKGLAYSLVIVGFGLDVGFNATLGSLMFLEVPRQWLFTTRCESYLNDRTWRGWLARWICNNALDPFEEGGHCH